MEGIRALLKPGGFIFMTDFVGPTKFPWLPKQLQVVNALIDLLPERYLIDKGGRRIEKTSGLAFSECTWQTRQRRSNPATSCPRSAAFSRSWS